MAKHHIFFGNHQLRHILKCHGHHFYDAGTIVLCDLIHQEDVQKTPKCPGSMYFDAWSFMLRPQWQRGMGKRTFRGILTDTMDVLEYLIETMIG